MNVQLSQVVNDITGETGMGILRAIVAGERDPQQLARQRQPNCAKRAAEIAKAVTGNYRPEHVFALQQALALYAAYTVQVQACDAEIARLLRALPAVTDDELPPPDQRNKRNSHSKNAPSYDVRALLYKAVGGDLCAITGGEPLRMTPKSRADLIPATCPPPQAGGANIATGRPLRFCMITTFYPPYSFGGDAVFVQRLSNELARRGHHVEVIHCIDAYRLLAGHEPAGTYQDDPNVIVHGLRSRVGPLSPLATQQTGYPLFKSAQIRQVLDQGFDVIHFHNISLVGGPGILSYGRALKLYTMHEHWLICPTHVLFRFNREACTRRTCFVCQIVHKRPPQLWRFSGLLKAMVGHVDAFISPSRFTLEKHRSMELDAEIVQLPYFVPEPEDPLPASAEDSVGATQRPYFLFVGRLERLKGVQTLIPVFRRYGKAELLIAGSGSFAPRLRRLAEGCTNIHFLGQQSAARVRALLHGAVALIVPSICFDAFPNVTLEAFCQETPAIVRNIGGLPEQIEQSGGGSVYSTDEELTAAMDQLLADRAYRDDLGRRGYAAYRQRWTADAYLGSYLALIRDLSARRSGA